MGRTAIALTGIGMGPTLPNAYKSPFSASSGGRASEFSRSRDDLNRTLDSVRKQQQAFKDGIAQSTSTFINYLDNFERETKRMLSR